MQEAVNIVSSPVHDATRRHAEVPSQRPTAVAPLSLSLPLLNISRGHSRFSYVSIGARGANEAKWVTRVGAVTKDSREAGLQPTLHCSDDSSNTCAGHIYPTYLPI